ncbi:MAG: putative membrane-anchored protein [Lentimonas sp.]|jgi:uncharacterized membrane-anchored protein
MRGRYMLLGLLVLLQFGVPLRMIQQRENVLQAGTLFLFKTQPIDPVDPFQGRYVRLRMEQDFTAIPEYQATQVEYNSPGYTSIDIDRDGFAYFSDWAEVAPVTGDFLISRARGKRYDFTTSDDASARKRIYKGLQIEIPFTRFYMDEAKAPRAERLAGEANRAGESDCWVAVRVLDGQAIIEDVFIAGESLRDLARASK